MSNATQPSLLGGRLTRYAALALAATWVVDAVRVSSVPAHASPRFSVQAPTAPQGTPALREVAAHRIPVPPGKPLSHSSSLVLVDEPGRGRSIVAYWFTGSRESGPDVEIASSRFDTVRNTWSEPVLVVNRHALAGELDFWVRRLGNPVGWVDTSGRVHLFAVATGLGGWAASRVVHLLSHDGGRGFSLQRVLPLSPWFNTSSLVRAPAVPLADGGALLPMYFEFGNKYPVAMRVSPDGDPLEIVRMSHDGEALQPSVIPLDALRAIALLRDNGDARRMKLLSTEDGGRTWRDQGAANIANPDSSVVGARLPGGTLVAAMNPSQDGRHQLAIALSRSGHAWNVVEMVESGTANEEFSYPALLVDGNRVHLTYTSNRAGIEHRVYELDHRP